MTLKKEAANDLRWVKGTALVLEARIPGLYVWQIPLSLWASTFSSLLCSTSFTGKCMCSRVQEVLGLNLASY